MSSVPVCDRSACPAAARHRIDLYGQDFHFCDHHWAELRAVLPADPALRHANSGIAGGSETRVPGLAASPASQGRRRT